MLINLYLNAAKFTLSGYILLLIKIKKGKLVLTVLDPVPLSYSRDTWGLSLVIRSLSDRPTGRHI
jgi:hypothetical protein